MTNEEMLRDLVYEIDLETIRNHKTVSFIKSLAGQFKQKGFLTEDQESALKKVHKEHFG